MMSIESYFMKKQKGSKNRNLCKIAANNNSIRALKLLYDNEYVFDIDSIKGAIKNNHIETVKWFINNKCIFNYMSPLMEAVSCDRLEIVKLLYSEYKDVKFYSELLYNLALSWDHTSIVNWLQNH